MKKLLLLNSVLLLFGCRSIPVRRILDVYIEKEMRKPLRQILFHTGDINILSGVTEDLQAEEIAEQIFTGRNARIKNPDGCAVVQITLQETPLLKEYRSMNAVTVIAEIITDHTVASVFYTEETENSLSSEAYVYGVFTRCFSRF